MPARLRSPSRDATRKQLLTIGYSAPWDAATEAGTPFTPPHCSICGGELGAIRPGSEAVCLACRRTGHDAELAYDLALERGHLRARLPRFRPRLKAAPA